MMTATSLDAIERHESNVRSYCRQFPVVFDRAEGANIFTKEGDSYIDFFAGAGALNYGHNPSALNSAIREYMEYNGIMHSLDLATESKCVFLERFYKIILKPRGYEYRIQFPGPTGTNAVEAAIKLARKVTGRRNITAFTNAFHGMTLGSLALTAQRTKRNSAGISLNDVTRMPFDGYMGSDTDSSKYIEHMLADTGSGIDPPAAIILETTQAEGGINSASIKWLQQIRSIADRYGALLIIDDIQVGCGRTGPFFSFEESEIIPDLICLSKSISGIGLPMSLVLIKPEYDIWEPGEHNGTFRGQNLSFVAATEALNYWSNDNLHESTLQKGTLIRNFLEHIVHDHRAEGIWEVRGKGMIQGIDFKTKGTGATITKKAFQHGLIIESCGPLDSVMKLLPPLTIDRQVLQQGLEIISDSIGEVFKKNQKSSSVSVNKELNQLGVSS